MDGMIDEEGKKQSARDVTTPETARGSKEARGSASLEYRDAFPAMCQTAGLLVLVDVVDAQRLPRRSPVFSLSVRLGVAAHPPFPFLSF